MFEGFSFGLWGTAVISVGGNFPDARTLIFGIRNGQVWHQKSRGWSVSFNHQVGHNSKSPCANPQCFLGCSLDLHRLPPTEPEPARALVGCACRGGKGGSDIKALDFWTRDLM